MDRADKVKRAEALARAREARGWQKNDTARRLGVDLRQYERYESGETWPHPGPLRERLEAFISGVDPLPPTTPESENRATAPNVLALENEARQLGLRPHHTLGEDGEGGYLSSIYFEDGGFWARLHGPPVRDLLHPAIPGREAPTLAEIRQAILAGDPRILYPSNHSSAKTQTFGTANSTAPLTPMAPSPYSPSVIGLSERVENPKKFNATLDADLYAALQEEAHDRRTSPSALTREVLRQALKHRLPADKKSTPK